MTGRTNRTAEGGTGRVGDGDGTPTVGAAVVDCLLDHGVDTVFGIPGKQTLPLNEALADRDARFVVARHETAVTHAAWGYAETRDPGEMAATVVVPGPGDMNAMNGLKNALNDCVPMVHVAVETEHEVRGGDGIHETPPDTYDNVVKENVLVETAESAVAELNRAIRIAREPPMGPVRVGIPKDFLASATPQASVGEGASRTPPEPPAAAVDAAADLLAGAEQPVVLAGGGVRRAGASERLRAFAEALDAPVVTTYKGKGTLPEDHALSAGVLCGGSSTELRGLLAESDAALAVGSDLDAVATGRWSVELPDDLVHVTLGADDLGTGYEPAVGIVADADRTLRALTDGIAERGGDAERPGDERAAAVRTADAARFDAVAAARNAGDPPTSVEVVRAVREALPRDAIVTADAGGSRQWTLLACEAYGPQSYVNPGSWATMGTALPSAMGAKLANPDADAVALVGDGGLLMCIHELHTLATEGIDVTVVALNNDDYAIISEEADRSHGLGPGAYGWADAGLDLAAVAEGMGVDATRVAGVSGIAEALDDARARDGPSLVEVATDPAEPQASEWMTRER
ncbi:thiamine pyrophosphate-binding protein [Haloparvum alkalitolerans]|uniref:thiamine pyrophosphate-binding protein n=1 Tax=Haloparvum alkalitolerans TaxID=1042953 RepID=UPI003CEE77D9